MPFPRLPSASGSAFAAIASIRDGLLCRLALSASEGWQSGRMRRSRKPFRAVSSDEGSNPSPSASRRRSRLARVGRRRAHDPFRAHELAARPPRYERGRSWFRVARRTATVQPTTAPSAAQITNKPGKPTDSLNSPIGPHFPRSHSVSPKTNHWTANHVTPVATNTNAATSANTSARPTSAFFPKPRSRSAASVFCAARATPALAGATRRKAERAGFEPATHLSARTRFPVALLRQLGHLSERRSA